MHGFAEPGLAPESRLCGRALGRLPFGAALGVATALG
jgi:hypothetical protein